jgi:hypothetical protein
MTDEELDIALAAAEAIDTFDDAHHDGRKDNELVH